MASTPLRTGVHEGLPSCAPDDRSASGGPVAVVSVRSSDCAWHGPAAVAEERGNGGDAHGVGAEHVGRHPAGDLGRDEVLLGLLEVKGQVVGDPDGAGGPLAVGDRARSRRICPASPRSRVPPRRRGRWGGSARAGCGAIRWRSRSPGSSRARRRSIPQPCSRRHLYAADRQRPAVAKVIGGLWPLRGARGRQGRCTRGCAR